jgi:hypothetical protein
MLDSEVEDLIKDALNSLRVLEDSIKEDQAIFEVRREEALGPVKAKILSIEEEHAIKTDALKDEAKGLSEYVKDLVLTHGRSIMSDVGYDIRYSQGRVSWNAQGLMGYAKDHPEIMQFMKMGAPYTALYRVKDKKDA